MTRYPPGGVTFRRLVGDPCPTCPALGRRACWDSEEESDELRAAPLGGDTLRVELRFNTCEPGDTSSGDAGTRFAEQEDPVATL
jgi:hypothetical protein